MLEEFLAKQAALLSQDFLEKIEDYLERTAELRPQLEDLAARLKNHDLLDELDTSPETKSDIMQMILDAETAATTLTEAGGILHATELICTLPTT